MVLSVCCLVVATSAKCPTSPFCASAKPFVTAVKGPSREGQSPPEHGLHVLSSDRLCHSYSQQARPARHPAPSLPWSRGKRASPAPHYWSILSSFHPGQPWGQLRQHPGQITLHTTALHNCPYQISTWSKGVAVKITTFTELRAILILSLTAAHNWMFFVVCSLLSIYISHFVVMAGYDIDWSARILTRVSTYFVVRKLNWFFFFFLKYI